MSGVARWFKSPDGRDVPVSTADPMPVTATSGTGLSANQVQGAAAAGSTTAINPVLEGARYNTTLPAPAAGQLVESQAASDGSQRVVLVAAQAVGADAIAETNVSTVVFPGAVTSISAPRPFLVGNYVFNGTGWDRERKPNASSRIPSSANSVNATLAKNAAGNLFGVYGYNSSATTTYLKLYNKASAPTVGTDTPVLTLPLPPTAAFAYDFASMYFSTGIAYGMTTDAADAGTTAVAAGAILGLNVAYA